MKSILCENPGVLSGYLLKKIELCIAFDWDRLETSKSVIDHGFEFTRFFTTSQFQHPGLFSWAIIFTHTFIHIWISKACFILYLFIYLLLQADDDHIIPLCLETVCQGHAVLIFCPTKNWCEKLSEAIAKEFYYLCRQLQQPEG